MVLKKGNINANWATAILFEASVITMDSPSLMKGGQMILFSSCKMHSFLYYVYSVLQQLNDLVPCLFKLMHPFPRDAVGATDWLIDGNNLIAFWGMREEPRVSLSFLIKEKPNANRKWTALDFQSTLGGVYQAAHSLHSLMICSKINQLWKGSYSTVAIKPVRRAWFCKVFIHKFLCKEAWKAGSIRFSWVWSLEHSRGGNIPLEKF